MKKLSGALIDDSSAWVAGMPTWLSPFNIHLRSYQGYGQALEFAIEWKNTDFVLLDYLLEAEGITAADVLRRISSDVPDLTSKVIIFSRKDRLAISRNSSDLLADYPYLSKRLEPLQLSQELRRLCGFA